MSTKKITTAEEAYLAAVKRVSEELFAIDLEMRAHHDEASKTPESLRPVNDMQAFGNALARARTLIKVPPKDEAS